MTAPTPSQLELLRHACGIGKFTKKPQRNTLPGGYVKSSTMADIAELVSRELLEVGYTHGPAGKVPYYEITAEGLRLAIESNQG